MTPNIGNINYLGKSNHERRSRFFCHSVRTCVNRLSLKQMVQIT